LAANVFSSGRLAGVACVCLALAGCATGSAPFGDMFASEKSAEASPRLKLAWAALQEREGKLTEAREGYTSVLKKDPKSVEAILGLARLDQLANRPEDAERRFRKALEIAPNSPEVHDAVGQFYADYQRWPEAVEQFRLAANAQPNEAIYRYHLAVALTKSGNPTEALAHFKVTVGEAEAHYNVGRILYDMGNVSASEEHFALAVMKNPQLEEARTWLEELRIERGGSKVMLSSGPAQDRSVPNAPASVSTPSGSTSSTQAVPNRPLPSVSAAQPVSGLPMLPAATPTRPAEEVQPAPASAGATRVSAVVTPNERQVLQAESRTPHSTVLGTRELTPMQREQMQNQRHAGGAPSFGGPPPYDPQPR